MLQIYIKILVIDKAGALNYYFIHIHIVIGYGIGIENPESMEKACFCIVLQRKVKDSVIVRNSIK